MPSPRRLFAEIAEVRNIDHRAVRDFRDDPPPTRQPRQPQQRIGQGVGPDLGRLQVDEQQRADRQPGHVLGRHQPMQVGDPLGQPAIGRGQNPLGRSRLGRLAAKSAS